MADQQSKLTFNQVKDKLALPIAYSVLDISDETERIVCFPTWKYTILNPVALIRRNGGSTHRVIDDQGVSHCYAVPEDGVCVVKWKSDKLVSF